MVGSQKISHIMFMITSVIFTLSFFVTGPNPSLTSTAVSSQKLQQPSLIPLKYVSSSNLLNADHYQLNFNTYLGGSNIASSQGGNGIAVDSNGNSYVTGYTDSNNFPTKNAYQNTYGGSYDFFVSKFSPNPNFANNIAGFSILVGISGISLIAGIFVIKRKKNFRNHP